MKFIIDTEEIQKQNIPLEVVFCTLALYFKCPTNRETFREACKLGLVNYKNYNPIIYAYEGQEITQKGVDLIEDIIINSEFQKPEVKDRFLNLAEELRDLYPSGKRPGTAYMWKDSAAVISKRLKALYKKYNLKYTDEQVINATKRYIESFNGDYTYMQLLKYFISKDESSQLLSYIENEGQENNITHEWTAELR